MKNEEGSDMDGQGFSREVAFSQAVINIGADNGNDIVLSGSSVADFHVLMHYENNRWSISPLNGAYMTTVNGRTLQAEGAPLQNGSIVEIGSYRLTMMLNGVNTDILIQSEDAGSSFMNEEGTGTDRNILLAITKMEQTELEAGASTEIELTVTNAGPLVANMQLQLQGIPSAWVQIIPPVLNLNEGRKGSFTVRISPPRNSSAEAGMYSLHFIAISPNYPRNTGIADTSLTILPYSEFLISGPSPMQLKLTGGKQADTANFVVINNSNAAGNYFIQSRDDANELNFTYQKADSGMAAGQETISVRAGDSVQIPMEVSARKIPLLGVASKHHHYYTNVTPVDRPGDTQTIAGEVVVKPVINTMLLFLLLILAVAAVAVIFQPYIYFFDCQDSRRSQVIVAGSSAQISWDVSRFASKISMSDGQTLSDLGLKGTQYVTPTASTTYTITAENFLSKLLNITHSRTVQVLVIPKSPKIDVFSVDKNKALFGESVNLRWSVESNASSAYITTNKAANELKPDNYTGTLAQGYQSDTLISLKAQNDSGYDMKSLFINVASDNITLNRFAVWVRPNGIAVPENNDVRRTTRWGSIQLTNNTTQTTPRSSGVNPQPAAQSNTLEIPDNFNSTGGGTQSLNPEVLAAVGQTMPVNTYSYQPTAQADAAPAELLVSPSRQSAASPTPAAPSLQAGTDNQIIRATAAPVTSPEGSSANRDFSVKLAEVVEDPLADSGYRVISYFPDYVLQKGEQILVEWNVDGVSRVKVENLSGDDLLNNGGDYAYPDKSVTYTLTAQAGETKKAYALPVRVAGDADDGEGSGLKCDLKANATTLKVPGSVMLTWTGGGNNRVQLISSTQAEKENDEAEKKKEEEAKAKGESYEKPKNPQLSGGTIGDYLQPSGFMRVNVDKQTTFVLNAYDGNNNVICTKSVEVKYEGGNDKKDIKLAITRIADSNDVVQPVYTKGQMISYTVALTDFEKGKEPTGAVALTDGVSTCSMTLPVTTCSFQAKKTGELTLTAVYAGDDTYNKTTATAKEVVIEKLSTKTEILGAIKPDSKLSDFVARMTITEDNPYNLSPMGVITFTVGSGSCDLDIVTDKLTCEGKVISGDDKDFPEAMKTAVGKTDTPYLYLITSMLLSDNNADRITANYKGDDYFSPSSSTAVLFYKVPTITTVTDAYKNDDTHANFTTTLTWDMSKASVVNKKLIEIGNKLPDGTFFFIPENSVEDESTTSESTANCVYDIESGKLSCEGNVNTISGSYEYDTVNMVASSNSTQIRVNYSGNSLYSSSAYTKLFENKISTVTTVEKAKKTSDNKLSMDVKVTPSQSGPGGEYPSGTITFKSGTVTCLLNIDDYSNPTFKEPCTGKATYDNGVFHITDMLALDGKPGETVHIQYSGDDLFMKSSASASIVKKYDTKLTIDKAFKSSDSSTVTHNSTLSWDSVSAGSQTPTGTVTYTVGKTTCVLTLSTQAMECSPAKAEINKDDPGKYGISVEGMQLDPKEPDAEEIKAVYSGDDYFNSSQASYSFNAIETELKITGAFMLSPDKGNLNYLLSWDDSKAEGQTPTGTVTFTFFGKGLETGTCVLDLSKKTLDCGGTVKTVDGLSMVRNMILENIEADSVRAEYSGDGFFGSSSSDKYNFLSVPTEMSIDSLYRDDEKHVSMNVELSWRKSDLLIAGISESETYYTNPNRYLMLNMDMDTGSCYLDLSSWTLNAGCKDKNTVVRHEFIDDTSTDGYYRYNIEFEKIVMTDTTAASVVADYEYDLLFEPSKSDAISFKTIGTDTRLSQYSRSGEQVTTFIILNWADDADGKLPGGIITLSSGAASCTIDITDTANPIPGDECRGGTIAEAVPLGGDKQVAFSVRGLYLGTENDQDIKAAYSGDYLFLESDSGTRVFNKPETSVDIYFAFNAGSDSAADVRAGLTWPMDDEDPQKAPKGKLTYQFYSGAAKTDTCILDFAEFEASESSDLISEDGIKFTCNDQELDTQTIQWTKEDYEEGSESRYIFDIKNIPLEHAETDRVKITYGGNNDFNGSSSETKRFGKVNTALKITEASKPQADTVTVKAELSWTREDMLEIGIPEEEIDQDRYLPSGNIDLTVGSDTCRINFKTNGLFCDSGLSGQVTPEYKRDSDTFIYAVSFEDIPTVESESIQIRTAYSSDPIFNDSVSDVVRLRMIETALKISDQKRTSADLISMNMELSWQDIPESGKAPNGIILLTSGNGSCSVSLEGDSAALVNGCSGTVTVDKADQKRTYKITSLKFNGTAANYVNAQYKGDETYLPSLAEAVFEKVDTKLAISDPYPYKSEANLAHFYPLLSWDAALSGSRKPTGTVTFTIGSDSCKMTFDGTNEPALSNCKGLSTSVYVDSSASGKIQWGADQVLLSAGTADRIEAEYSGDDFFNTSKSEAVLFKTIPTTMTISSAEKTDASHVTVEARLSWTDETDTFKSRPGGSVKFTVGSKACTLDLDSLTEKMDCDTENIDMVTSEEGLNTFTITGMLVDDKTASGITVEYVGDGYFQASSTNAEFGRIDPKMKLTIMDEGGTEHDSYVAGQKVRAEIEMTNADMDLITGTVTVTIDTASCTITLPQTACYMDLPVTPGERTAFAKYGGDTIYAPGNDQKDVKITAKEDLTLAITQITDEEGNVQDAYAINEKLRVYAKLSDYDNEEPTGTITVTLGSGTCTISYGKDEYCIVSSAESGKKTINAEYGGDNYYNKASASTDVVIAQNPVELEIVKIVNDEMPGAEYNISQPYYVYDGTKDQTFKVQVGLEGPSTGNITVKIGDISETVGYPGSQYATFSDKKIKPGEYTVTAIYDGSATQYASRKAESTIIIENEIEPKLEITSAYRDYDNITPLDTVDVEFKLTYNSDLPAKYRTHEYGPKLESCNVTGETKDSLVTFKIGSTTCVFNLNTEQIDTEACKGEGTAVTKTAAGYKIEQLKTNVPTAGSEDKINGTYDQESRNIYFTQATAERTVFRKNGGQTYIELADVLKYSNASSHVYMTATMYYDPNRKDDQGKQLVPDGTQEELKITAGSTEVTCQFDVSKTEFTCGSDFKGTLSHQSEGANIQFTFRNFPVTGSPDSIKVEYLGDNNFPAPDSFPGQATLTPETAPDITITKANKTSSSIADVEFTIGDSQKIGDLTGKWKVFDRVRLGSSKSEAADENTCIFDLSSTPRFDPASGCEGTISVEDNSGTIHISIQNLSGIIRADDTEFTVWFVSSDMDATEDIKGAPFPYTHDTIKTNVSGTDCLRYNTKYGFLTLDLGIADGDIETFDKSPTGYVSISATGEDGSPLLRCYLNVETNEPSDCGDDVYVRFDQTVNKWKIYNISMPSENAKFTITYNGDEYYDGSSSDLAFTSEETTITIDSSVKTGQGNPVVYTSLTIENSGSVFEKYDLNHKIKAGSYSGSEKHYCTFTYDPEQDSYVPEEGTCTIKAGKTENTYVLENFAKTADTHFSLATMGLESDVEYTYQDSAYTKFDTAVGLSKPLKMVVNDSTGSYKALGFMTIDFSFDVNAENIFGLTQEGTITITLDESQRTCKISNLTDAQPSLTCTDGMNGSVSVTKSEPEEGAYQYVIKNIPLTAEDVAVTLTYKDADENQYYKYSEALGTFTSLALPKISQYPEYPIAKKTSARSADLLFSITDFNDLFIDYDIFPRVRLGTGKTSAEHSCDMNVDWKNKTASFVEGSGCQGSRILVIKSSTGYNINVTNWTGLITRADMYFRASLFSEWLDQSEYPYIETPYSINKGSTYVYLSTNSYNTAWPVYVQGKYMFVQVAFRYNIRDSYEATPTGRITLILENEKDAPITCSYDLSNKINTCGGTVIKSDVESGSGYKVEKYVFMKMNYTDGYYHVYAWYDANGDNYFYSSDKCVGNMASRQTPKITVNEAYFSSDRKKFTMKYTLSGMDGLLKYMDPSGKDFKELYAHFNNSSDKYEQSPTDYLPFSFSKWDASTAGFSNTYSTEHTGTNPYTFSFWRKDGRTLDTYPTYSYVWAKLFPNYFDDITTESGFVLTTQSASAITMSLTLGNQ